MWHCAPLRYTTVLRLKEIYFDPRQLNQADQGLLESGHPTQLGYLIFAFLKFGFIFSFLFVLISFVPSSCTLVMLKYTPGSPNMPCNVTYICICLCCSLSLQGGCWLPACGLDPTHKWVLFGLHCIFLLNLSHHVKIKKFHMKSWISGFVWKMEGLAIFCLLLLKIATGQNWMTAILSRWNLHFTMTFLKKETWSHSVTYIICLTFLGWVRDFC